MAHENGEFTYYSYDALDRLVEERRVQNPTVYGFAYQYDAASNRTQRADLVTPAKTTDYVINALNLIQSETSDSVPTVYEYDLAQRMTRRASPSLATYFTHDERDLPTKLEFESTGDFTDDPREFHYTGTGERAVVVGELGGTAPTLLAYDGTKLLTERMPSGFTWGEYRWAGGSLIGSEGQESGNFEGPVMDERGSVERLAGVSGQAIYDRFGVELVNNLGSLTRTRFVSPVFLRLNTTGERFYLSSRGVYLPLCGMPTVRLLGSLGQMVVSHPGMKLADWGWRPPVQAQDRGLNIDQEADTPVPGPDAVAPAEPNPGQQGRLVTSASPPGPGGYVISPPPNAWCFPLWVSITSAGAVSATPEMVKERQDVLVGRNLPAELFSVLGSRTVGGHNTFSLEVRVQLVQGSAWEACDYQLWHRGLTFLPAGQRQRVGLPPGTRKTMPLEPQFYVQHGTRPDGVKPDGQTSPIDGYELDLEPRKDYPNPGSSRYAIWPLPNFNVAIYDSPAIPVNQPIARFDEFRVIVWPSDRRVKPLIYDYRVALDNPNAFGNLTGRATGQLSVP
ncbi:MAG: hypothetical protein M9894_32950 [Planctomycetes bacterium]|nr:hypothetical protein [Planctomycetota bacterium]